MIKFLLRKNFWDGIDYFLMLIAYNVFFVLFGGLIFAGAYALVVPHVYNSTVKEYVKGSSEFDWSINNDDASFVYNNVEMEPRTIKVDNNTDKIAVFNFKSSENPEEKPYIEFDVKEGDYIAFDYYLKNYEYVESVFQFDESKKYLFSIVDEEGKAASEGEFTKEQLSYEYHFVKDGKYRLYVEDTSLLITNLRTVHPTAVIKCSPLLGWVVVIIGAGIFFIPLVAFGSNSRKIADFNTPNVKLFFKTIGHVWKFAFGSGVFFSVIGIMIVNAINYYWRQFGMFGSIIAVILCVFLFIAVCSLQYFIPLYFLQDNNNFKKCLKKSFIIFFDNPGFSIFMLLYHAFLGALSMLLLLIIPGFTGIQVSMMNALRLRLKKYDWLDEHPGYINDSEKRANVPWGELIAEDKESLGNRKFSSLLYSWK